MIMLIVNNKQQTGLNKQERKRKKEKKRREIQKGLSLS
jgi:hypothetical protein